MPQGLCLEEPPVVRVSELSCRLWVFPFSHKALAVAGGGGGRIKKVGFCRENVIFELPYPAARFAAKKYTTCSAGPLTF